MLTYILEKLSNADVTNSPFNHIYIENFLPSNEAQFLRDSVILNKEKLKDYKPEIDMKSYGKDAITRQQLFVDHNTDLPSHFLDVLLDLKKNIFSLTFLNALSKKLNKNFDLSDSVEQMILVSHRRGFYMNPHTDVVKKKFTIIYNLALDTSPEDLGTTLYTPKVKFLASDDYQHYDRSMFERTITTPFLFNSCLLFSRTTESFHGVEKIETDDPRYQIHFNLT